MMKSETSTTKCSAMWNSELPEGLKSLCARRAIRLACAIRVGKGADPVVDSKAFWRIWEVDS